MRMRLVDPNNAELHRNQLAAGWEGHFGRVFSERILPQETHPSSNFRQQDAPLYIPDRTWRMDYGSAEPAPLFKYESRMDELFWAEDGARLIFIEGEYGCGKSTFLAYYLRSYCPELGRFRDSFKEKLIINIDLRGVESWGVFDRKFYERTKEGILAVCKSRQFDITSHDCYAMWDTLYDWTGKSCRADQADRSDERFRAQVTTAAKGILNSEVWVSAAMDYLGRLIASKDPECPFRYVVFVLDNLDQSPLDVQKYALLRVRELLEEKPTWNIWRIFVPLWSSTLALLQDDVLPLPMATSLPLGEVNTDKLLSLRTAMLQTEILSGHGARFPSEVDKQFLQNCVEHAHARFRETVESLAGVSARIKLELWKKALSSHSLYNHYERLPDTPQATAPSLFTSYVMLDAMLTGDRRVHPCDHRIFNLFCLLEEVEDVRSVLIGPHTLFALSQCVQSYDAIIQLMHLLGYDNDHTTRALGRMQSRGLISIRSATGPREFLLRRNVASAFEKLMTEPAYIDNMAMVSPVAPNRLPMMKVTSAHDRNDFLNRVTTSLEFLAQLNADEIRFAQSVPNPGLVKERNFRLPSVFKRAALQYRKRIDGLRDGPYLKDIVTESTWREIRESSVFHDAEKRPEYLPFVGSGHAHA